MVCYILWMIKDFDEWNKIKKSIHAKEKRLFFREGEIWWISLGVNIDYEIDGKGNEYTRPVIVMKKYNQYSFLALPLSTSKKINKYKIPIGIVADKEAVANLSQMRNIDSKRLVKKIGRVERGLFQEIKKKASQVNFG